MKTSFTVVSSSLSEVKSSTSSLPDLIIGSYKITPTGCNSARCCWVSRLPVAVAVMTGSSALPARKELAN